MLSIMSGLAILLVLMSAATEASRILIVFPTPAVSHRAVIIPLARELFKRGHDVVIVTTKPSFPELLSPNFTEIVLKFNKSSNYNPNTTNEDGWIPNTVKTLRHFGEAFEEAMSFKEVQELLSRGESYFDLLILESWVRPLLAITHIFKAPVIQISSSGANVLEYEAIGSPTHPILYPTAYQQRVYNLTRWEKLVKVYKYWRWQWEWARLDAYYDEIIQRTLSPDVPPLKKLACNVRTLILNEHPVWAGYRPDPPSVVRVWGIHLRPPQPLPEDLESYLNASVNGVVYMSLGTSFNTYMLSEHTIEMFVRVLSLLPYNVLLKWDKEDLPGQPKNVRISKWFPQADILRHPKVQLFITQGGVQSTDEAIDAGVPLLGVPMIADQWFQTEQYARHGIGIQLSEPHLTYERLTVAIHTIINDDSYRRNVLRLRALLRDEPEPRGVARAAWHAEHAIHQPSPPRAPTACISWAEYLELAIVCKVLLAVTIVAAAMTWACVKARCFIARRLRKVKVE